MKFVALTLTLLVALLAMVGGLGLLQGDWVVPTWTAGQNTTLGVLLLGLSLGASLAFTLELSEDLP